MRAFVVSELVHPSKIRVTRNAPEPKLKANDVLIEVYSAGLNFFDVRNITVTFDLASHLRADSSSAREVPAQASSALCPGCRIRWTDCGKFTNPEGLSI